jgi:hypothetical protein
MDTKGAEEDDDEVSSDCGSDEANASEDSEDGLDDEPTPSARRVRLGALDLHDELTSADAAADGDEGLVFHAQLRAAEYARPFNTLPDGQLRPRRQRPQIRALEFFSALEGAAERQLVYRGRLNGWPALTDLELRSITCKRPARVLQIRKARRLFDAVAPMQSGHAPRTPDEIARFEQTVLRKQSVRVTLRASAWSGRGWSAESPGHVFWFDALAQPAPRLVYGARLLAVREGLPRADPVAARVHMFGHRYAKLRETTKDRLTYHAALLIEWAHGEHCSVVELAWLNGLGGYGGRCNFVADRDAERPAIYDAMPAEMKQPVYRSRAEVRLIDVPERSVDEFIAFLAAHTGHAKRFLEPSLVASEALVRPTTRTELFGCLLSYARANPFYLRESRNCQTFSCDLFRHLSGNAKVEPFSAIIRPLYKSRVADFAPTLESASPVASPPHNRRSGALAQMFGGRGCA